MAGAEANQYFLALLAQQEYLGLVGLGKLADPVTQSAEIDLQKTRVAIGTLDALEEKTRGQLTSVEDRELRRILTGLRLNYVEELNRLQQPPTPPPTPDQEPAREVPQATDEPPKGEVSSE